MLIEAGATVTPEPCVTATVGVVAAVLIVAGATVAPDPCVTVTAGVVAPVLMTASRSVSLTRIEETGVDTDAAMVDGETVTPAP